jgi:hypothetical protein
MVKLLFRDTPTSRGGASDCQAERRAGTSDSIRARRPAFDKEELFDGAPFVLVVSAERGG